MISGKYSNNGIFCLASGSKEQRRRLVAVPSPDQEFASAQISCGAGKLLRQMLERAKGIEPSYALGKQNAFFVAHKMSALPSKAHSPVPHLCPLWANCGCQSCRQERRSLHTFRVISQTRPSARQSKCVFPERWATVCSITRPPNPLCAGSSRTFGPRDSVQRRCNCPSASCDHFRSTWPSGTAKAPYLAELVANSCKVIAMI